MKHTITYLLLLLFTFQTFEVAVIYVEFKLNQDYIAEYLCINKDTPELKYNGCCQLKKEITEKEEREKDKPQQLTHKKNVEFIPNYGLIMPGDVTWSLRIIKPTYPNSFPIHKIVDMFHPPKNHA